MDRVHAVVHGRVQGVNFRSSAHWEAMRLELLGWICNKGNGTVEVIAEGRREDLERFVKYLHQGPPAAEVEYVDLEWEAASGEWSQFSVL